MRILVPLLLLMALAGAAAAGCGSIGASIDGQNTLQVGVHLWHNEWTVFPDDWEGFRLTLAEMGSCDDPVPLHDELIPIPPLNVEWQGAYAFDLPRLPTTWAVRLVAVLSDGSTAWVDGCGDPVSYVHVSTGQHRLRGRLGRFNGGWILLPCEAGCWNRDGCAPPVTAADLGVSESQLVDWYVASQGIELLGMFYDGGMPSPTCFDIQGYALTDEPCLPVSNDPTTWSALKQAFR
ncbi:MAG TPA: hypothetical protein PLH84_07685 [Candidatus Krumholzibacteria bacterium]|nr:hypothetical protein [Candidatus Krumholzibacteria bacterium]